MFSFVLKCFRASKSCSRRASIAGSTCTEIASSYRIASWRSRIKFWQRKSLNITSIEQTHHVTYLGNVPTFWARGDQCIETPLAALWRHHLRKKGKKTSTRLRMTICANGARVVNRELGVVHYWANRISYVANPPSHPEVLVWAYRHIGRRGRPELRVHAVLCRRAKQAHEMAEDLKARLANALREFRTELQLKTTTQHASQALSSEAPGRLYRKPGQSLPERKKFLVKSIFKQPLERSQSAPKLDMITEEDDRDEDLAAETADFEPSLRRELYFVSTGQLNF